MKLKTWDYLVSEIEDLLEHRHFDFEDECEVAYNGLCVSILQWHSCEYKDKNVFRSAVIRYWHDIGKIKVKPYVREAVFRILNKKI